MSMFCYQCEQTARTTACTTVGVCGKDADTAALQDLLVHAAQGISRYAARAARLGARDRDIDVFVVEALFTTVTNVNFDPERIARDLRRAALVRDKARMMYQQACAIAGDVPETLDGAALWKPADTLQGLVAQGQALIRTDAIGQKGDTIAGLEDLLLFGIKGSAAYADHALVLGKEDQEIYAWIHNTLDFLAEENHSVDDLLGQNLFAGKMNLRVMELLDEANTDAYGHPVPTPVRVTPIKGKAILVSGHDLKDLEELLKQTEGQGINIYTHGEMLPAHGYPELKKFGHLAGNYGGAWQDQAREFEAFPGAILMTTNCIQQPRESYKARIFTTGLVAWPGVVHVGNRDFSPVIEAALAAEGFAADEAEKTITVGFGHNTVLGLAETVIGAVKSGALRHFYLIGGCDGAKSGRNYYTDFAQAVPDDCVILTLACGKYRFNKLDFGEIGGIPRLLDVGQCNDAFSAIKIASALADAFDCGVNDLPLSMILSWYEQKAVCILLTLLYLGITDIRLGPSLPAFISPAVLEVLVEKFGVKRITTPERDLKDTLEPDLVGAV